MLLFKISNIYLLSVVAIFVAINILFIILDGLTVTSLVLDLQE